MSDRQCTRLHGCASLTRGGRRNVGLKGDCQSCFGKYENVLPFCELFKTEEQGAQNLLRVGGLVPVRYNFSAFKLTGENVRGADAKKFSC